MSEKGKKCWRVWLRGMKRSNFCPKEFLCLVRGDYIHYRKATRLVVAIRVEKKAEIWVVGSGRSDKKAINLGIDFKSRANSWL